MLPSFNILIFVAAVLAMVRQSAKFLVVAGVTFGAALALDAAWTRQSLPAPPLDPERPRHVVLIGIDGLTKRALGLGNTPVLDVLAGEGAQASAARALAPTMSAPNWASHLMGGGPKQHRIRGNEWRPEHWDNLSLCGWPEGAGWPSIFDVVEAQRPKAGSAVFYDWVGIGRMVRRGDADMRMFLNREDLTAWAARRHLRRSAPLFTFIHFDHVDAAGHSHGFDTWQYHQAVAEADRLVGTLKDTLEEVGLLDETLLMIISDHGGRGRFHGGADPRETAVPWILWGKGVKPMHLIDGDITVQDTAPTLAHAMGLKVPGCWTGRAATPAFSFR